MIKVKMVKAYEANSLFDREEIKFGLNCLKNERSRFKNRADKELILLLKDGFMIVYDYNYALGRRTSINLGIMFYDTSFESEANICILPESESKITYEADYYEMEKQMLAILAAQGYTEIKIWIKDPNPGENGINKNDEIFLLESMNYTFLNNSDDLLIYSKYIY